MEDTMSEADSFQDVADESHAPKVNWPASDAESFATEESSWLVVEAEDSEIEGWEKEDAPGAPGEKLEPAIFHSAVEQADTRAPPDDVQDSEEDQEEDEEDKDEEEDDEEEKVQQEEAQPKPVEVEDQDELAEEAKPTPTEVENQDELAEEAKPTPTEVEDLDELAEEVTNPDLSFAFGDQSMVPTQAVACMASAKLLAAQPLMLGSGQISRCDDASGDVTARWSPALECSPGVSGAYCLGRIVVEARKSEALPVVASVVVLNDGEREWSVGTALRIVAGDAHGFDMMPAGPLPAGQAAELRLDLLVPMDGEDTSPGCGKRSAWVLTDEYGEPFGPVLVLEVVWM